MSILAVKPILVGLAAALLALGIDGNSTATARRAGSEAGFVPTAAAPGASGAAKFVRVERRGAKLRVKVSGLQPNATYKMLAGGLNVGTFTTTPSGRGRIRFRAGSRRSRADLPLDFDPAAGSITIVAADGTAVLAAELDDTGAQEPSASASPSVSPFDGDEEESPDEPSPTASPSASPPGGGDGDGDLEDEPSPSISASASPSDDEGDPSPTTSASVSEDDVSPSVSDDEDPSPSPSASPSPSPGEDDPSPGDDDGNDDSGSDDDDDNSGPGSGDGGSGSGGHGPG